MSLPWETPEIAKIYNPEWIEFFQTIGPKIEENLQAKNLTEHIATLTPAEKKKLLTKEYCYLIRDKLKCYLPINDFKDQIQVTNTKIKSYDGFDVPVRVYQSKKGLGQTQAVYISHHGGGWLHGGLHYDEYQSYWLVHLTGVTVIDVDYRMIPDYTVSVVSLDILSVYKTVAEQGLRLFNVDPSRITVGGYSAGAKSALMLGHLSRDLNLPLALVFANVPCVQDLVVFENIDDIPYNGSYKKFENDLNLSREDMKAYEEFALQAEQLHPNQVDIAQVEKFFGSASFLENMEKYYQADIMSSPNFQNLPRHIIVTGQTDVLGDGGRAYAKKLIDEHVTVTSTVIKGLGHSHHNFTNKFEESKRFLYFLADSLKHVAGGN
ncbi:hypothetical protein WICPIJ_000585 [Wickerhamomyces pijperi]|uniref:Alpha/beta hydrolase fold-3 domain-containing protein n=1 Tax=Wickerhamomyces pijperi TaxID=599730 RepID=A0A9P8TSD7_WICPI|nr:hypothetical protein WICPIJ_000585 [Wickerhamomyces pijperi]